MSLVERLQSELHRLGSSNHPLAHTLPGIVAEYEGYAQSRNRWKKLCAFLAGGLLVGGLSVGVLWLRLDAIATRNEMMAIACLNPGRAQGASKVTMPRSMPRQLAGVPGYIESPPSELLLPPASTFPTLDKMHRKE